MLMKELHLNNFLTPPSTELSPFLMADNQLCICNGVNLGWKKGSIVKDLGYSKVGSTLETGKPITGLHNFRQSSTTQKILATVNNTAGTNLTLQYNNSGTWTAINVGSTYDTYEDCQTYMEDFIGYCFIVGYDSTDNVFLPVASLTWTTFSTSTCVTNMPQAKYIKRYRDRLYVANCFITATAYPYRVYFSSVPSAWAITWTAASDFIDVDFSEQITGLGSNWDKLAIFTEFSTYIYDQDTKTKMCDIGCINGRTIANLGSYLIWANKDNVWASTGGRPTPIANDIKELLLNSTPSNWRAATVGREYYLYLWDTEANGLSYNNCLAIFDSELGYWRWRELYDEVTALTRYTSGSEDFLYMWVSDGMVHVKSKYTDSSPVYADDGKPIISNFRTKAFDFWDPAVKKTINKIISYCKSGQWLTLRFRVWNKNNETVMPWTEIGQLSSVINSYDKAITGNFIQFEGKEYSSKQPFEFYGLSCQLGQDSNL
jgi:hypothetical protein